MVSGQDGSLYLISKGKNQYLLHRELLLVWNQLGKYNGVPMIQSNTYSSWTNHN